MSYSNFIPHEEPFPVGPYDAVARACSDADILVEVGVGWGHSVCYMTEALTAFSKRPQLYAFDLFDMPNARGEEPEIARETPWREPMAVWHVRAGGVGARLDAFLYHLKNNPCADRLTDWSQFPSWTICDNFKTESVAFVSLNASRREANVDREIRGWWRTLKIGGTLLIHGAAEPGVTAAVCRTIEREKCSSLRSDDVYILYR